MVRLPNSRALALACLATLTAQASSIIREPFAGVRYTHRTQTLPRVLSVHVVEIDLTHPAIRFLVTPDNGEAAGESTPRTVSQFVSSVGAQIGINATFFSSAGGGGFNNVGLVASRGDAYSPFEQGNGAAPVLHISADNVAQILRRAGAPAPGIAVSPEVTLYNAVSGNERIVTNTRETAGTAGDAILLHPRTAAGVTANGQLILLIVDGRQAGLSLGMYNRELADLLIHYGAVDAVNLDGGGSSTLVFSDPTPRALNRPSDGRERAVAASVAVFAAPATRARDTFVFADFYGGDTEGFPATLVSARTQGLLGTSAAALVQSPRALERGWHQQLTLRHDPSAAPGPDTPAGGWHVRHTWTNPVEAATRPAQGFVGFWVRTQAPGTEVALAVAAGGTTLRSSKRAVAPDGAWHLYEWDLSDPAAWPTPPGRSGGVFTLDSLQFFGPPQDAVIDVDLVAHNALGPLGPELVPSESGHLANLSVRSTLADTDATLHLGIVLAGGTGERQMLVRAAGPGLAQFGVGGSAADPRLTVLDARGGTVLRNDNWSGNATLEAAARVGAFAFPSASLDAAGLTSLGVGDYFLQANHLGPGPGEVLVEAYDASHTRTGPRLVNLSTRTVTATSPLIAGFVVSGGTRRVVVRAVGPSLAGFGVTDALRDPRLTVYADNTVRAMNDDWGGGAILTDIFTRVGAFPLPADSRDAAILLTLNPGAYTVHVQGANSTPGSVLLELYEVP